MGGEESEGGAQLTALGLRGKKYEKSLSIYLLILAEHCLKTDSVTELQTVVSSRS